MGFRGSLFGTKVRAAVLVVVLVAASVVGAYTLGVVGAPAVTGVENRFGEVDDETTTINTDIGLRNPNPVGVQLGGASVDYTVSMNDVEMARGGREGVDLPRGDSEMAFTTAMRNDRIPKWWVSHIRNGERTDVTIDASVHSATLDRSFALPQERTVETDIISEFRSTEDRPVNANHPLVSDPVLVVRETDAQWGEVTESETPIDASMTVYNPKSVPYVVTELGYNVTMNGVPVGNGTTDETHTIPGGAERTLDATTVIDNSRLDEWWVSHLRNDQRTDLRIEFHAKVELPGGSTVRVPLEALTYEETIETDIFGTKDAANGTDAAAGGSATATRGTTGGEANESATPETTTDAAADETTASGGATTDDGGPLGGSEASATESAPTDEGTADGGSGDGGTDTDDGLLGLGRAVASHGILNSPVA